MRRRIVLLVACGGDHHQPSAPTVAAILVASMRFHFLDVVLNLRHKGPNVMPCEASFKKGQELGWFEHGSCIIVFAPPASG